jgi:hypothetical protein
LAAELVAAAAVTVLVTKSVTVAVAMFVDRGRHRCRLSKVSIYNTGPAEIVQDKENAQKMRV